MTLGGMIVPMSRGLVSISVVSSVIRKGCVRVAYNYLPQTSAIDSPCSRRAGSQREETSAAEKQSLFVCECMQV